MDISAYAHSNPVGPARSRLALLAALALLVTSVSGRVPGDPASEIPPQREILLNGLRVVSVQKSGGRASVVCVVRAGSMFDPAGKSGLANITAGLLARGAGSYSRERIEGELSDAGATIDVRTEWDATWIVGEGPVASVPVLMDVISLMVTAPRFTPEDVEAVKQVAAARVAAEVADPATRANRAFAGALYGSHTYGRAVWGDSAAIASITAGDVKVFYDRFYAANTAVLGVCTPMASDQISALARTRFGRWTKKKVVPATFLPPTVATTTRVLVVDTPGSAAAVVRAGFMVPGRSDANPAPVKVLAERLEHDLKQRIGGVDALSVRHDLRMLQSPFVVAYTVPVARLDESFAGVAGGFAALQSAPVPADGGGTRLYFTRVEETCAEEARTLAAADYFAGQKLAADPANYRVDEQKVALAARSVLKPSALTIVVVGDATEVRKVLEGKYTVEVVAST